jgi:hypothetical protein
MKKRGRKAGTGSFIQVSLDDLNKCLKPNAKVIVWNRYASMLGLQGKPVEAKYDVLVASVNSGNVDMNIENFDKNPDANLSQPPQKSSISDTPVPDLIPKPSVTLDIF